MSLPFAVEKRAGRPSPAAVAERASYFALAVILLAAAGSTLVSAARGSGVGHRGSAAADEPVSAAVTFPLRPDGWFTFANGDSVNALALQGDTLWAATRAGGIVRWNLSDGTFRQLLHPQDEVLANDVFAIEPAPDGTLWFGTAGGLSHYLTETDTWQHYTRENTQGKLPSNRVTALKLLDNGELWVGMEEYWDAAADHPRNPGQKGAFVSGGLVRFNPASGAWATPVMAEVIDATQGTFRNLPSNNITSLEAMRGGWLAIGTRPYHVWQRSECVERGDCPDQGQGSWVEQGGGIAFHRADRWVVRRATDQQSSAYSNIINDLAADAEGNLWVAGRGKGAFVITDPDARLPLVRYQLEQNRETAGLSESTVVSIDVSAAGHVWLGMARFDGDGAGIDGLDPGADLQSKSDDLWLHLDLDERLGSNDWSERTPVVAKDILAHGAVLYVGTDDLDKGPGWGVKRYDFHSHEWRTLQTTGRTLPSNNVTSVAISPTDGSLWVGTFERGLARWDGREWTYFSAYQNGDQVTTVTLDSDPQNRREDSVALGLNTATEINAAFPLGYLRIDTDPTLYRIVRWQGYTRKLFLSPRLQRPVKAGMPVYTVVRGIASRRVGDIVIDSSGRAWVSGRKTMWDSVRQKYLDGGLSRFDGVSWTLFTEENTQYKLPDDNVQSLVVDKQERVWAGTGDWETNEGDGLGVYDQRSGQWLTPVTRSSTGPSPFRRICSNSITSIAVDEQTGNLWIACAPAREFSQPIGSSQWTEAIIGGGVSMYDGQIWRTWMKTATGGATFKTWNECGSGVCTVTGFFNSIAVGFGRAWAGGWAAERGAGSFHWPTGTGIDMAVNECDSRYCLDLMSPPRPTATRPGDPTVTPTPTQASAGTNWQAHSFAGCGLTSAIAIDGHGNVWAGSSLRGRSIIPAQCGIKVYNGESWQTVANANSGLAGNETTDIVVTGRDEIYIGTFANGVSWYRPNPPPTPTFTPTSLRTATRTPTPGPSPTTTRRATATRGPGERGDAYLPIALKRMMAPFPVPPARTATSTPASDGATATQPIATQPAATSTPPTPVASATSGPSATPSLTRTPTIAPTATQSALREWAISGSMGEGLTFYDVFGVDSSNVWAVGQNGDVRYYNGRNWSRRAVSTSRTLRSVSFIDANKGWVVGEGGAFYETTDGGQSWRNVAPREQDDWYDIDVQNFPGVGPRGWAVGFTNGRRIFYDGSAWVFPTQQDRNGSPNQPYTAVDIVSDSLAYATSAAPAGGKVWRWSDNRWNQVFSTQPLFDVHVPSESLGRAVGRTGIVVDLLDDGTWEVGLKPSGMGSLSLYAIFAARADLLWTGGERGNLHYRTGPGWLRATPQGLTTQDIEAIWLNANASDGWAVGSNGLLMRYGAGR